MRRVEMMRFIQFIAVALGAMALGAEEPVLPPEAVALLPGVPMQPTRPGPD